MNKFIRPTNQKSVFHSYSLVFEKLGNNELDVDRAEAMNNALNGMNRVQALEIKRAEVTGETLRIVESKNFDDTTK